MIFELFILKNELLSLDPSNFHSIKYYLSKFKTLKLLLEGCTLKKDDDPLIYGIIAILLLAYFVFLSTFHFTRESLITVKTKYRYPSLDSFYESLISEQEKILHLGFIKTANHSNKTLVT